MLNLDLEPAFNVVDGKSIGNCHLVKLKTSAGRSAFGFTFEAHRVVLFDGSVHHSEGALLDFGTDFRIEVGLPELAVLEPADRARPGELVALGKDDLYLVTKPLQPETDPSYVNLQKGTAHVTVHGAKAAASKWRVTLSNGRFEAK
jgi:hypothetical protein